MKKIVIKSNLKEDEALKAFKTLNLKLQEKGLLSKGDELLSGIDDQDDGTILIEVNADLMDKDKYKSMKSELLSLGTLVSNDLKNFDELEETPTEPANENNKSFDGSVPPELSKKIQSKIEFFKKEGTKANPDEIAKELGCSVDEVNEVLKNFDDNEDPLTSGADNDPTDNNPKPPVESKGQEKEDKESIIKDKVESTLSLHDTEDLLINQKSNNMFETLLFSEEDLKKDPQNPENPEETKEAPKDAPEVKEHDDKEPEAPKDPEKDPKEDDDKKPSEVKEHDDEGDPKKEDIEPKSFDDLYFSDEDLNPSEIKSFDDLYFSEEEIKEKFEETEEKLHDGSPATRGVDLEDANVSKKDFDELSKKVDDLNVNVSKVFDALVIKTPEKKECPIEKHLALKTLAEYMAKAKSGKDLNVAEKYFCDAMKQHFSDEEIKTFSEEHKDEIEKSVKDEPKVSEKKEEPKTEVPQSKADLIKSLNKEKTENTLKGLAEANKSIIK